MTTSPAPTPAMMRVAQLIRGTQVEVCNYCKASILWPLTAAEDGARRMPIDREPVTDGTGTALLTAHDKYGLIVTVLMSARERRAYAAGGWPLRTQHSKTCTRASAWVGRPGAGTRGGGARPASPRRSRA